MSQNSPVDGLKWDKNRSNFTENFIEDYNGDNDVRIYLTLTLNLLNILGCHSMIYLPREMNIDKEGKLSLVQNLMFSIPKI